MPGSSVPDEKIAQILEEHFKCLITREPYEDPVVLVGFKPDGTFVTSGQSFSKEALLEWLSRRFFNSEIGGVLGADPYQPHTTLKNIFLVPNEALTRIIEAIKKGKKGLPPKSDPVLCFYKLNGKFYVSKKSYERAHFSDAFIKENKLKFIPNHALPITCDLKEKEILEKAARNNALKKLPASIEVNVLPIPRQQLNQRVLNDRRENRNAFFEALENFERRSPLFSYVLSLAVMLSVGGAVTALVSLIEKSDHLAPPHPDLSSNQGLDDVYVSSSTLQPGVLLRLNDYLSDIQGDQLLFSMNDLTDVTSCWNNPAAPPVSNACWNPAIFGKGKHHFFYFPHNDNKDALKEASKEKIAADEHAQQMLRIMSSYY